MDPPPPDDKSDGDPHKAPHILPRPVTHNHYLRGDRYRQGLKGPSENISLWAVCLRFCTLNMAGVLH